MEPSTKDPGARQERKREPAAIRWRYPLAWLLALGLLFAIDVAVTRSPLLWAPTSFEHDVGARLVFSQAYQTARKLYGETIDGDGAERVALIGNSRMWMGLRDAPLQAALAREDPKRRVRVSNLSIFGSGPGVMEVIARHVARAPNDLAVIGVSGSDLGMPPDQWRSNPVVELMQIGAGDPPYPIPTATQRLDRWLRSVWPLYRFREFARAALVDRVWNTGTGRRLPERFESRPALFEYMRPGRGSEMERGYQRFLATPSLASFVSYLEIGQPDHVAAVRERVGRAPAPDGDEINRDALDALLAGLAEAEIPTLVVLMPENPLLAEDEGRRFHRPELSLEREERIRELTRRHGASWVDGRRWLPAESFLDLDHVMPDLGGLEQRLAPEILRALASPDRAAAQPTRIRPEESKENPDHG